MNTITSINADILNDSRNIPTLSVTVTTDTGAQGVCMVPSGASTGTYEAYELRDDGTSHGNVTKAQSFVNGALAEALLGMDVSNQREIDARMIALDGTPNKSNLGGNSILGVSVACAKAAAHAHGKEFYEHLQTLAEKSSEYETPYLYFNLINGGKHATTKLAFQEYHVVPQTSDIHESLDIAERVQNALGDIVKEKYGEVSRGDEGGYAVPTENIREPLDLLVEAVKKTGLEGRVKFALDVAATSFYDEGTMLYRIGGEGHTKEELHDTYLSLIDAFPIISIEDPFYEEDFEAFSELQSAVPSVIIVGDDLTVTNSERVSKAVAMKSITGLLVKPNQIGSVSETVDTITYAQKNGIKCIISHRSGETLDDMIADFAKAFCMFGMKSGARGPQEREVKYRRLEAITHN